MAGKTLLYVMAVDAEYGVHLRERISPLMTGVGPVEAAVTLTRTLAELASRDSLPDLVVSLGSAGSARLEQAEVYQATSVCLSRHGCLAARLREGRDAVSRPARRRSICRCAFPASRTASLSTGANIVSGATYETIAADMVEMETFAVLRACQSFGIPLIGLRGISDGKAELKHIGDWTEYLHVIDEKLADAVDALEQAVETGEIAV